eukprot:635417-Pelagomonas_calceolata.AAC.6
MLSYSPPRGMHYLKAQLRCCGKKGISRMVLGTNYPRMVSESALRTLTPEANRGCVRGNLWVPSSHPGQCGRKIDRLSNGAWNQQSADGQAGAPFVPRRLRPTEDCWIMGEGMLPGIHTLRGKLEEMVAYCPTQQDAGDHKGSKESLNSR